jgi:F0F1-type ATP synthase assembly protein I
VHILMKELVTNFAIKEHVKVVSDISQIEIGLARLDQVDFEKFFLGNWI